MPLLYVVGVLMLVGVLVWAVNAFPYGDAKLKELITTIVIVVAAVWVISLFFPTVNLSRLHVGR